MGQALSSAPEVTSTHHRRESLFPFTNYSTYSIIVIVHGSILSIPDTTVVVVVAVLLLSIPEADSMFRWNSGGIP